MNNQINLRHSNSRTLLTLSCLYIWGFCKNMRPPWPHELRINGVEVVAWDFKDQEGNSHSSLEK